MHYSLNSILSWFSYPIHEACWLELCGEVKTTGVVSEGSEPLREAYSESNSHLIFHHPIRQSCTLLPQGSQLIELTSNVTVSKDVLSTR
jgi:hypothetical protein